MGPMGGDGGRQALIVREMRQPKVVTFVLYGFFALSLLWVLHGLFDWNFFVAVIVSTLAATPFFPMLNELFGDDRRFWFDTASGPRDVIRAILRNAEKYHYDIYQMDSELAEIVITDGTENATEPFPIKIGAVRDRGRTSVIIRPFGDYQDGADRLCTCAKAVADMVERL